MAKDEEKNLPKAKKTKNTNYAPPLVEEVDYYIERGRWVFTEHYLRKRGYCCQSGCRHCPYGFKKSTNPQQ